DDPKRRSGAASAREWTLGAALRSVPFWTIACGHLALGTALFIIYTHFVAHLVEQGFPKLTAAFLFGILGLMRVVGTFLWGYISDGLGRAPAYGLSILVAAVGILAIAAIGPGMPPWLAYAAVVVYGLGHSAGNPTYGAVIGDIYAGKNIGTIFGFLEITFGIGMALGSWAGGAIFDVTGSYRSAFMLSLACFVLSFVAIQASAGWHRKNARAIGY
ncbi:MAG TPA: MFS transporter, partial [Thermomicrobiales bacterium]|nr:MFS transporter [Thermomicrobiales bacterium]